MLGLVITILFAIGAAGLALRFVGRFLPEDPAAQFGLAAVIGLGSLGTLTYLIGLLPGGTQWGIAVIGAAAAFGLVQLAQSKEKFLAIARPQGPAQIFVLALGVLLLLSAIGVIAPSTSLDWDSLAYQMAVPKIWLNAGRIEFISFIHHSNFPGAVNSLFVWGLMWGGQAGAKAFCWVFFLAGIIAVFGLGRSAKSSEAGWWSALAFASIPVACWEAGTAYVDLANGLFFGLGVWMAARAVVAGDKQQLVPAALLWGFAIGSKYTALPAVAAIGLVLLVFAKREMAKSLLVAGAAALLIGSPAYVRNVINTGNPIYPYLYSKLGGKNWDTFSDTIYREEQATFGVGRNLADDATSSLDHPIEPIRIGGAILGLAVEPGRYTNPRPRAGFGFPFQAVGFAIVAALVVIVAGGRSRTVGSIAVACSLVCLLMWFALSEQSRYIIGFFVPVALAVATVEGFTARLLRVAVGVQAALTAYVLYSSVTTTQLEVLGGKRPEPAFSEVADELNKVVKSGRVALFEEVFGFYLDVPYFWANPGHSTEIGYENLHDGDAFADSLKKLGCTHAYLKLDRTEVSQSMVEAMQATTGPVPNLDSPDIRNRWRGLFVDAVRKGRITPMKQFRSGIAFEIHSSRYSIGQIQ